MKIIFILFAIATIAVVIFYVVSQPKYKQVSEEELKGVVRTNLDSPSPTTGQLARRENNSRKLAEMGLPVLKTLPVIEDEGSFNKRDASEVVLRAISVAVCAIKGEGRESNLSIKIIKEYGIEQSLTNKEKEFIYNENLTEQDFINNVWQYERLYVLLWYLGYVDEILLENKMSDAAQLVRALKGKTVQELVSAAKIRSDKELFDLADYYYRVHWSAIELRLKNKTSDQINEEIIMERHYALNWLIKYMGQTWDEISTDT